MPSKIFPNDVAGFFENDNPRKFTLSSDFIYTDDEKDIRVVVPKGFTTDWNSVPRAAWAWFAPWEYMEAGIVHDWLYTNPAGFGSVNRSSPLSKETCDDIHRRILDLKGCRWSKRQAVWFILHTCGGPAWRKHRDQDVVEKPSIASKVVEAVADAAASMTSNGAEPKTAPSYSPDPASPQSDAPPVE